jgi:hypothetical protein
MATTSPIRPSGLAAGCGMRCAVRRATT